MSEGLIHVTRDGLETFYTASCACGWSGGPTSAIELIELDLVMHFERHGRAEAA